MSGCLIVLFLYSGKQTPYNQKDIYELPFGDFYQNGYAEYIESLGYIAFGLFILGLIAGSLSMIHIDNPETSFVVTLPLFMALAIPAIMIVKGIRKATYLPKVSINI